MSKPDMKALGAKGGKATKAKRGADYFRELGRKGGLATAREHGDDAELLRAKLAGAKKGGQAIARLIAAGKVVLEIDGANG